MKNQKIDRLPRKSEEDYQTLLDTIPHGIQEIDTSGIIVFVNEAYNRIFGYEKGEVIGTSILDKLADDSRRDKLRDYLKSLLKDQPTPTPFFEKNQTKEGRIIEVQVDWNYKRDNKGGIVGFISVLTDISERKNAEIQREKLITELNDALSEITELRGFLPICASCKKSRVIGTNNKKAIRRNFIISSTNSIVIKK